MSARKEETWYSRNKEKVQNYRRQRLQTAEGKEAASRSSAKHDRTATCHIRAMLNEIKSKPCMDCKASFNPVCMDFDHRPGETKKFNISKWKNRMSRASISVLLAEIAKCDLVCANCHRIRTFVLRKHADNSPRESASKPPQLTLFVAGKEES